ncbi:MAG: hypothetical protein WCT20_01305 [Candidatus Babeliales bacterium]|jgi:hypothetical protein
MDTTMKCSNCGREMGLAEFLTYAEAYFLKLIIPATVPFLIAALANEISNKTKGAVVDGQTRGVIDQSMSGLANNYSIACPHCKKIDWYPASGPRPEKLEESEDIVS